MAKKGLLKDLATSVTDLEPFLDDSGFQEVSQEQTTLLQQWRHLEDEVADVVQQIGVSLQKNEDFGSRFESFEKRLAVTKMASEELSELYTDDISSSVQVSLT